MHKQNGSKHNFISGCIRFGKITDVNCQELSLAYRRIYDTMVQEEKFCVIKPYQTLIEGKKGAISAQIE